MADDIEPLASAEEVDELLTAIGRRPAVADDIGFTPVLADPPLSRRGRGAGRPEGAAKQLARQHPGQWVLARVRPGRKRGSGMLDSASEWTVAIRWLDGAEFGVDGEVTATYIKFEARQ